MEIARQQVPPNQVVVVRERPFSSALRKAFEAGLDLDFTWTLCLDADVLLRSSSIALLISEAEKLDPKALGLSGLLFDFFARENWLCGQHLYRTALLGTALREVPSAGVALRPETFVKEAMARQGHPWSTIEQVVGAHDHEQYFYDIFRSMVVRAIKSRKRRVPDRILRHARLYGDDHDDYRVAGWGIRYGLRMVPDETTLDSEVWREEAETLFVCHGLSEKEDIAPGRFVDGVEKALRIRFENGRPQSGPNGSAIISRILRKTGRAIERAGVLLQESSNSGR